MAKKLLDIRQTDQLKKTSCWAACGRVINNFFALTNKKRKTFDSDIDFGNAVGMNIDKYENIEQALVHEDIKCYGGQDDTGNIPTFQEIKESIDGNEPIAVCVSVKEVKYPENVKDGHYILIVGYDDDGKKIYIMDPDPRVNNVVPIPYSPNVYEIGFDIPKQYWGVTYYTEDGIKK
ncbi:C39 family peptidase [Tolypothrix sp. VBCCA 56010]|uniref:C39 family peptidase n=1 Tax=Tolypothrix sp. VBCCA 56010 TaxID=3137731 RepID=UPI003D7CC05B